jgi:hypothetical protein
MKHLLSILLTAIVCATASAQTIKPLSYNASNNAVIAATNTNALAFNNNIRVFDTLIQDAEISWSDGGKINFEERRFRGGGWTFDVAPGFDDASGTRASLGIGATWLTNTNATNFRTDIGLGSTNAVTFGNVAATSIKYDFGGSTAIDLTVGILRNSSQNVLEFGDSDVIYVSLPIQFVTNSLAGATRTNLGLRLVALTNTSNVTIMRALSGSGNTNHPYSGSISVVGTNNTNTLVFSNGILQSVQ